LISLYLDEHVARAVTEGLRLRGIDVLTVQEDGRRGASDAAVLDRATEVGRPLFTQDEDLLIEASRRIARGTDFAGVIYAHQLRVTIGDCVRNLVLLATAARPDELRNRVEYLPL
jgi:predicted nuclease of predicted toxin-antitoxin system